MQKKSGYITALLHYLAIKKTDLLGFSDGGCTTLQIAMSYPALVNKAVAVSCNYKRDGMVPGFFEMMDHASFLICRPAKNWFLKVNPDKKKLKNMFEKDKAGRIAFKDWTDDDLRSIKAPVMLMAGDKDVITLEHTVTMSKIIPVAKRAILPGLHGVLLGEVTIKQKGSKLPEVTAALVDEFLNE